MFSIFGHAIHGTFVLVGQLLSIALTAVVILSRAGLSIEMASVTSTAKHGLATSICTTSPTKGRTCYALTLKIGKATQRTPSIRQSW